MLHNSTSESNSRSLERNPSAIILGDSQWEIKSMKKGGRDVNGVQSSPVQITKF